MGGCGIVVIDRSPGEETSGSAPTTTPTTTTPDGPGGGGSGGGLPSTGGGGAAPAGECDGIEAKLGQPIAAGKPELLTDAVFPHMLRQDDKGVFFVATDMGGSSDGIHRIDKATKAVTSLAGGLLVLWDMALAGDNLFLLTQDALAWGSGIGPSKIRTLPTAGGSMSELAVLEGHETYQLAVGKGGLYSVDFMPNELLFVPFAGGSFVTVAEGAATELSAGKDRIYFLVVPGVKLGAYDELTGATSVLWPNEDPMRHIRQRGGPVFWLAGSPVSRLRRLQNGVADTVLCTAHFAFDLALNDTHAFVAASQYDETDDTDGNIETAIWRVPLAGGPPELLIQDQVNTLEIEVDGTHLYWITHDYQAEEYGVWRMPLPPG